MPVTSEPVPLILVGTYHKTGTKWMLSLFQGFCDALGDELYEGAQRALPASARVFFENHSHFHFSTLRRPFRGLRIIRDPRDVLISGARYHARASEAWLHQRHWKFRGRTYQEAIRRRRTLQDAVLFEMEHAGGATIRDMLRWDRTRVEFVDVKYEDLITDRELDHFRPLLRFLGYRDAELPILEPIIRERSLFGGQVDDPSHVADGRPAQWREVFDERLRRAFLDRFDDVLVRLGYETDASWGADAPP